MKIFLWNAWGLVSTRAFNVLFKLKQDYHLDLMFLLETKLDSMVMENIRVKLGFIGKLVVDRHRHRHRHSGRGLCLLWSSNAIVELLSFSQFHIDTKVPSHQDKV
ncbi:hypothetical protein ACOSP7_016507 [Xanthoceras sorbifolium]